MKQTLYPKPIFLENRTEFTHFHILYNTLFPKNKYMKNIFSSRASY